MLRTTTTLALLALLAVAPAAAAGDRGVERKLRGMTLEEKVGQLFVANVYGESARTTAPADVEANETMYGPGIRNGRDLIR